MSSLNNGLDELDAQLAAFTALVVTRGAPAAAHAAASVILGGVEERVPERTGDVRNALEIVESQDTRRATAAVSVADSQKGGANWHAVLVELGTSRMQPHPYMRPAFEVTKEQAAAAAAAAMQNEINQ